MDRTRVAILLLGAGAVALLAYSAADAAALPWSNPPAPDPALDPWGIAYDPVTGDPVLAPGSSSPAPATSDLNAAVSAMLATIRQFEANGDYSALVGGGSFSGFESHPAAPERPAPPGWRMNSAKTNWYNPRLNSSAAGGYQDIYSTWIRLQRKLGLPDYTPASQDAANAELLAECGAVFALQNGDVTGAFRAASSQWASLPFSTAGQNPKPLTLALSTFNNFLSA